MLSRESFARLFAAALDSSNHAAVSKLLFDLRMFVMMEGGYTDEIVDTLLTLVTSSRARDNEVGWKIWAHLHEEWGSLSPACHERVREAAEHEFDRSDAWMWSFTIALIVAERFSDARALDALLRFRGGARETARSLLPDAIRNLARHSTDDVLRERARSALQSFLSDSSAEVRREAADAVAKWK